MSRTSYLAALSASIDNTEATLEDLKLLSIDPKTHSQPNQKFAQKVGTICGLTFGVMTLGVIYFAPSCILSLVILALAIMAITGLLVAANSISSTNDRYKKLKTLQKSYSKSVQKLNFEMQKIRFIIQILKAKGIKAELASVATLTCLCHELVDVRGSGSATCFAEAAAVVLDVIKEGRVGQMLTSVGFSWVNQIDLDLSVEVGKLDKPIEDGTTFSTALTKLVELLGASVIQEDKRGPFGNGIETDAGINKEKTKSNHEWVADYLKILIMKFQVERQEMISTKNLIVALTKPSLLEAEAEDSNSVICVKDEFLNQFDLNALIFENKKIK